MKMTLVLNAIIVFVFTVTYVIAFFFSLHHSSVFQMSYWEDSSFSALYSPSFLDNSKSYLQQRLKLLGSYCWQALF